MDELLKRIGRGEAALFIGEGAIVDVGGPTEASLREWIRSIYPDAMGRDLHEDVDEATRFGNADLAHIRAEVAARYANLKTGRFHDLLPKFPWRTLFVHTVDGLVERAYAEQKDTRLQALSPILGEYPIDLSGSLRTIPLFRLSGSCTAVEEDARPVITTRDRDNQRLRWRRWLSVIPDLVRGGILLFVGWDTDEAKLIEFLRLLEETTAGRGPAVSVLIESPSPRLRQVCSALGVNLVERQFVAFVEALETTTAEPPTSILMVPPSAELRLRGNRTIPISADELSRYGRYFEVLNHPAILAGRNEVSVTRFLSRSVESWGPYRFAWDFQRDAFEADTNIGLFDWVSKALRQRGGPSVLAARLHGATAIGKTTLACRLCYETYVKGSPVILVRNPSPDLDFRLIEDFWTKVQPTHAPEEEEESQTRESKRDKRKMIPILIVIDQAEQALGLFRSLYRYLESRDRRAVILAVTRSGVWETLRGTPDLGDGRIVPTFLAADFTLRAELSPDEGARLGRHFGSLAQRARLDGETIVRSSLWLSVLAEEAQNTDILVDIARLSVPSLTPIVDSIKRACDSWPEDAQRLYRLVASVHRFHLEVPLSLGLRASGLTYARGLDLLKTVLREEMQWNEEGQVPLVGTRHPYLADLFVTRILGGSVATLDELQTLLGSCVDFELEADFAERFLVSTVGPNGPYHSSFFKSQIVSLFEAFLRSGIVRRSILHHQAILLADLGKYERAEEVLLRALQLQPEYGYPFRREERNQNLLTSLGVLYGRMAQDSEYQQRTGISGEALWDRADATFAEARYGEFPNGYAYHAAINALRRRGSTEKDPEQRDTLFGRALSLLDEAYGSLDEMALEPLEELAVILYADLDDWENVEKQTKRLLVRHGSARGFVLAARRLLAKHDVDLRPRHDPNDVWPPLSPPQLEACQKAEELVDRALTADRGEQTALALKARLYRRLNPFPYTRDYLEFLTRWAEQPEARDNLGLYFDIMVAAFHVGPDAIWMADDAIANIEALSTGHLERFSGRDYLHQWDSERNPIKRRRLEGQVRRIHSRTSGYLYNASFRREFQFSPVRQSESLRPGDNVSFELWFTLRGPQARELKRRSA